MLLQMMQRLLKVVLESMLQMMQLLLKVVLESMASPFRKERRPELARRQVEQNLVLQSTM